MPDRDLPEALRRLVVVEPYGPDMIGVAEAARRLGVSRSTVHRCIRDKALLAWTRRGRGIVLPAEQILDRGRIVPGIRAVLEIIDDAELAWELLIQDWPFADDVARPIDKLKAGAVDEVVGAALGYGDAMT